MNRPDDELTRALRALRATIEPSEGLEKRLERALGRAEREETARLAERGNRRTTWLGHLRLTLPAVASVAIAMHVLLVEPTTTVDGTQVAEHEIDLPDGGHGALHLSLSLDEHEADFASIRLDVPHGMHVMPSQHAISSTQPSCHDEGCVYEFIHPTTAEAPHLQLQVSRPGRYRMEVEHASDKKRLREVFVVHARP